MSVIHHREKVTIQSKFKFVTYFPKRLSHFKIKLNNLWLLFFKQWGGVNKKKAGRMLAGRTYDEMPFKEPIAASPLL